MAYQRLKQLESESIFIIREAIAQSKNPVMFYSIGKDSGVLAHLVRKAFLPLKPPVQALHIDTTWKFREMITFRDAQMEQYGFDLIVHKNGDGLAKNVTPFTHDAGEYTDIMKTMALRQALDKYGFDVALGGARRDEEKSRAKERVFSRRGENHQWNAQSQNIQPWRLYNMHCGHDETWRVFPLSDWTEIDVWQYIYHEKIPVVPLYFAAKRKAVERDGQIIVVDDDRFLLNEGEVPMMRSVRFRTLGCYPLTGAMESTAQTIPDIIDELKRIDGRERDGRLIDLSSPHAMENKKAAGYF